MSDHSVFFNELKSRVDAYFNERGISQKGNALMVFKVVFFFVLIIAFYIALVGTRLSFGLTLLLYAGYGLSSACFVFSVAHDASHGAFSEKKWVNTLMSYSWNLMGISSYNWALKHNIAHHSFTNIVGLDQDIDPSGLLRLNPGAPLRRFHRFQHIYVPFLYCLFSFFLVFVKDFKMMGFRQFGHRIVQAPSAQEWLILIVTKVVYITYSLVIPAFVLDFPFWQVLLMYLLHHFMIGLMIGFVLSPVHITEGTVYHKQKEGKRSQIHNWADHQIECTIDFSAENPIVNWFAGGLNTHVIHHLFPHICHIHYMALTRILKKTCQEHDVEYINLGFFGMIAAHLRYLYLLGRKLPEGDTRVQFV